MSKKVSLLVVIVAVTLSSSLITNQVLAANHNPNQSHGSRMFRGRPVIAGVVSAINGTNIDVSASSTVYSIDISEAKIIKDQNGSIATATPASLLVGDTVRVQGTISGTNIVAKRIIDGKLAKPAMMGKGKGRIGVAAMMRGEKVSGAVSSISGNVLSINSSGNIFSVNGTRARVIGSNHRKGDLNSIQIGDSLNIFGIVGTSNSTSLRALLIEDTSRGF